MIEYWKSKRNGNLYFHIKAKNYKIVGQSEGYKLIRGVLKGINAISKSFGSVKVWKKSDLKDLGTR